jgi:hypothetical protein
MLRLLTFYLSEFYIFLPFLLFIKLWLYMIGRYFDKHFGSAVTIRVIQLFYKLHFLLTFTFYRICYLCVGKIPQNELIGYLHTLFGYASVEGLRRDELSCISEFLFVVHFILSIIIFGR